MIAIFNIEKEAQRLSNEIHEFLSKERKGYNAEKWGYQGYDNGYFHVKVPDDFKGDIPKVECLENADFKKRIEKRFYDKEVEILPTKEIIIIDSKEVEVTKYIVDAKEVDPMTLTCKTILTESKIIPK